MKKIIILISIISFISGCRQSNDGRETSNNNSEVEAATIIRISVFNYKGHEYIGRYFSDGGFVHAYSCPCLNKKEGGKKK